MCLREHRASARRPILEAVRDPNCEECGRLWREYSAATIEHLRIENKLRLATLCRDAAAIDRLTGEAKVAADARGNLRTAIRDHEAQHSSADAAEAGT